VFTICSTAYAAHLRYWEHPEATVTFRPATLDDVRTDRVRRLSIVPFLADGRVVLLDEQGHLTLVEGALVPGEHVVADAPMRLALEQAGFRPQGTHAFASDPTGAHVALWIDGERYAGSRPHRRDARWWTGDALAAEAALRAQGEPTAAGIVRMADAARCALTDDQYWADSERVLDAAYLAAESPEGGSGFGGSAEDWRDERSVLCDAIDRDGSFLDTACANGHLLDSIVRWCRERGVHVEPYGLDISKALVDVARRRLPQWRDRFWVGNALTWRPSDDLRFDVVHALLECVPDRRHRDLVQHLLDTTVAPGGRLLVSHYNAGRDSERGAAAVLERLGYEVAGETRPPVRGGRRMRQPSAWIVRR
jgi:2-polyprenyl-3-methyl-5-hydroxy-6-metoxy-1,4-benzoquinol methylase